MIHPEVQRFGKFGIVGLSNIALGFAIANVIYFSTHWLTLANAVAYVLSAVNGFIWNRKWTFKERRGQSVRLQALRFTIANLSGYTINIVVMALTLAAYTSVRDHHTKSVIDVAMAVVFRHGGAHYSFVVFNAATMGSTAVVTIWNYFINRDWSFKD